MAEDPKPLTDEELVEILNAIEGFRQGLPLSVALLDRLVADRLRLFRLIERAVQPNVAGLTPLESNADDGECFWCRGLVRSRKGSHGLDCPWARMIIEVGGRPIDGTAPR